MSQHAIARRLLSVHNADLRALARRRPLRALLDIAGCYAIILFALGMFATVPTWWVCVASFILVGNRQYALSILAHDGRHGNLLPNRRLNNGLTIAVLCAPLGLGFYGEKASHWSHHRLLGRDSDPVRWLYIVSNKATRSRFLLFMTGLAAVPRAFSKALRSGARAHPQRRGFANFLVSRWAITLPAQGIIWLGITMTLGWQYYFGLWVAPLYALLFVPHKVRMFCEHAIPERAEEAADAGRLVTFVPNRLECALFAPMHIHFHAEHHLWPFVPYSNLPRLHELIGASGDVHIRRSYIGFLWSYFRRLPLVQGTPVPQSADAHRFTTG